MPTLWEHRYARRTQQIQSSAIREILKFTQAPDVISFAGGLPAPEAFPLDAIREAYDFVLTEIGPQALQYFPTEGVIPLRELICEFAAQQGLHLALENILITSGSQQALDLLGKIFINRGDHILVESPSYLGALQAFNAYGAEYIAVPFDDEGMRVDALEEALRCSPKFIYIIPTFQNPTGMTMSLERRKRVIELADHYGVPIVEDDPYGKLRYEGENIPSVLALDSQFRGECEDSYCGNVIYLSTFSKMLAPGLRMAWVTAPAEVIRKFVQGKQGADLHSPTINQFVAYQASKDGFLDQYIEKIRAIYGERRLVMLAALKEYFPAGMKWTRPEGGMFLWVTLPEGTDAAKILQKAIQRKVAFVPGGPFHPNGGGENTMRLNFSNATPEMIREGISRLGQVLQDELNS
ncbi:MAG TPA: aminotransferase [Chloroflexi bacterium]|nr:aminotransferase [Chloroflexota bacterium]